MSVTNPPTPPPNTGDTDIDLRKLLEEFAREYAACEDEKYYTEGVSNIWNGKRVLEIEAAITKKLTTAIQNAKQEERIKILNKLSLMDADVLAAALPVLKEVADHELQARESNHE